MKKTILLIISLISTNLYADIIEVRADNWCPYNCGENDSNKGFMIDVLEEILSKDGHTVNYKELNWARSLQEVRDGKITAVVGATEDDKEGLILSETAIGESVNCVYGKEGLDFKYDGSKESLQKVKLGVVKDYTYGDPIDSHIKESPEKVNVFPGEDAIDSNVNLSLIGRIDVFVEDQNVVDFYLKNNPDKKVVSYGCDADWSDIYVGFSAKNPKAKEYADLLDKGLKDLESSGRLKEIKSKYGIK